MPELALPKGDAQQQGTAPVARLRPAQLPAGLSPGARSAPEEPGQTQIPPLGASLFHKELLLSQCWQQGERLPLAFAKPCWPPLGSTRPGTLVPRETAPGLACLPATVHNAVLGNNQEEQKKV